MKKRKKLISKSFIIITAAFFALAGVLFLAFFAPNLFKKVEASGSGIAVETEGNRVFNKMAAILEEDKNSSSPVFSDFRENFGGGYIEGDHLIIYVKGGISNQGLFEERMLEKGISKDRYDIQTVDYSYSELESQMQSFWDFRNAKMANNVEWAKNIYSLAISQAKNCVKISLSRDLDINDYPELQSFLSEMSYELIYLDEEPIVIEE